MVHTAAQELLEVQPYVSKAEPLTAAEICSVWLTFLSFLFKMVKVKFTLVPEG